MIGPSGKPLQRKIALRGQEASKTVITPPSARNRLPQQDGETNLTGTRIGELICFPVGQARRVIRLTLGVGSVRRIAEFRQQPTVEIEPQPTLVRFALRSA